MLAAGGIVGIELAQVAVLFRIGKDGIESVFDDAAGRRPTGNAVSPPSARHDEQRPSNCKSA
jgi:hypothetical protein